MKTNYEKVKEWRMENIDHCREKDAENARKRRKNNPEKQALRNKKYRDKKEQERVLIAGRSRADICELCGDDSPKKMIHGYKTVFDHDHVTGKFRGWICDRCNKVLGLVNDNVVLLKQMAEYLKGGSENGK